MPRTTAVSASCRTTWYATASTAAVSKRPALRHRRHSATASPRASELLDGAGRGEGGEPSGNRAPSAPDPEAAVDNNPDGSPTVVGVVVGGVVVEPAPTAVGAGEARLWAGPWGCVSYVRVGAGARAPTCAGEICAGGPGVQGRPARGDSLGVALPALSLCAARPSRHSTSADSPAGVTGVAGEAIAGVAPLYKVGLATPTECGLLVVNTADGGKLLRAARRARDVASADASCVRKAAVSRAKAATSSEVSIGSDSGGEGERGGGGGSVSTATVSSS